MFKPDAANAKATEGWMHAEIARIIKYWRVGVAEPGCGDAFEAIVLERLWFVGVRGVRRKRPVV